MDRLWHYVQAGKATGPVPEEQLRAMLASGGLRPEDLVWHEGMAGWTAAKDLPELMPRPAEAPIPLQTNLYAAPQAELGTPGSLQPSAQVSAEAVELLRQTKPWVRLFSVLGMIGVLMMGLGALAMTMMSFGPFRGAPFAARFGLGIGFVYLLLIGLYVPPVLYLHRYASRIRDLMDDPSAMNLEEALRAQKSFWKYLGIFALVGISVYILVFIGIVVVSAVMGLGHRL
ncbi:MAG TPA: DUF4339 domain-containing protein [Holophaga sp.]|nr:DUF4339 domain-containing protein [Holophaga sp.]